MAAAQVAKKLKDKRQKKTIEGIFNKVDKDGNGSISLSEYFEIFEKHGIEVNRTETNRVIKLAGEDGNLTKENFVKILKTSDFFMKSFDKNKDGVVTETDMMTRAELAFSVLDKDKSGFITSKELKHLSKRMSEIELGALMAKLDSDGDGQLSLEEFKVLFNNADKRRKNAETESPQHGAVTKESSTTPCLLSNTVTRSPARSDSSFKGKKVIHQHLHQPLNKAVAQLQEAACTPCLAYGGEKTRRHGCSFRDMRIDHQLSGMSLCERKPRIIITKSSPDILAGERVTGEKRRPRTVSETLSLL